MFTMSNGYGPRTDFGAMIHAMKYRGPEESFDDYCVRYARTTTDNEKDFRTLLRLLRDQVVLPAGRQQISVGRPHLITAFNCFVGATIPDDTKAIFESLRDAALTLRTGGGCGWDFSSLRPDGELVRGLGLGAKASGPISFMECWHAMCGTIMSAGERRGAMMGVLRCDHPDIMKFIRAKQVPGRLTNFNISVAATDEFMEAVDGDKLYKLRFGGREYGDARARDVWAAMMEGNWDNAEPGVLFIDRINKTNPLNYCETIAATNPCFAGDTLIATRKGAFPIRELIGEKVEIHDGQRWVSIDNFRVTGENQRMVRIELQDGSELRVTEKHSMILADGTRKEAGQISISDELMLSEITYDGSVVEKGAYLKGFLLGDGAIKQDRATLWVYEPKWGCKERLMNSCLEIEGGEVNTNALADIQFNDVREGVVAMTGLTPRKKELTEWVNNARAELPARAFQWDRRSKVEFLAGLFDSDGSASDNANGFGYQITSIHKQMLTGVQMLLKSIGVRSKLALGRDGGERTIKEATYYCQPTWRLSIGQTGAIELANEVDFSRLTSFADKQMKYITKPRAGRVVAVESDGIEETVYCCTVPDTHSVSLGIGILSGQCAEQPLPPNGACLLGSINILKLLIAAHEKDGIKIAASSGKQTVRYEIDFDLLKTAAAAMVRAFDNVIDRTVYPHEAQKQEALAKRRMGVGVTGMANALEVMGLPYGSPDYIKMQAAILEAINTECYKTSCKLAQEKGTFPLWDAEKYCEGEFFKKSIPEELRDAIKKHGLRNGLLTSIAPTGTISMAADNVSSGIEPVFSHRANRLINTPEGQREFEVIDAALNQYGIRGRTSSEVTPQEHIDVMCAAQQFVDSSISKTCNVTGQIGGEGPGTTYGEFQDLYMRAYRGGAKGCTTFNANGKRMGILQAIEEPGTGAACVIDPTTGIRTCDA